MPLARRGCGLRWIMSDTAFNFTLRSQRLLTLARAEAERFNHNLVGAEHLLLGLIKLGEGVAADVLRKMDVDLGTLRVKVERQIDNGGSQRVIGNIPYSPHTEQVLVLAEEERKKLNHSYLGTEHILLGMLRAGDTVAFRALTGLGVEIGTTRSEIVKMLEPPYDKPLNPESIRAFLRLTTLKECLGWSEHTQDQRVRDALKPLLFDRQSGAIRKVQDRILQEELFRLAMVSDSFRRFLEIKATLDRITAGYLTEQIEGL
jgi:ATP-dependent Clp protease ATP-binding subunit ClpA